MKEGRFTRKDVEAIRIIIEEYGSSLNDSLYDRLARIAQQMEGSLLDKGEHTR